MYSSKEKEKARRKEYDSRPEVKERKRERARLRSQTPEYKEYQREYMKKKRQDEEYKQKEKERYHKYYIAHREQKRAYDKKRRNTDEYRKYHKEKQKEYRQTEQYKEYYEKYKKSGKAKICRQRYYKSEKGQAAIKAYRQTEKYKEYLRNRKHKKYREEGGKEKFTLAMLKRLSKDQQKWMKQIYCNHVACLALRLVGRSNVCFQCGKECKPDFHHTEYPNWNIGSFVCKACHYKLNNNIEQPKKIIDLIQLLNEKGIYLFNEIH